MTVDYDLIILGHAPVGRYAALRASQTGARVALVTPDDETPMMLQLAFSWLIQLNRALRQQNWLEPGKQAAFTWPQLSTWTQTLAETVELSTVFPTSLSHLTTAGVDVIQAAGEFCQRPRLGLFAGRLLRARAYLLTPLTRPILPPIPGLVQFVTCDDWLQRWLTQPQSLVILGTDPRALLLAQVLNRLNSQVTLLTRRDRLIPDLDLSRALQLQLEAEGITVLTRTEVQQVEQSSGQSRLRVVDLSEHLDRTEQLLETEAILLASSRCFDLSSLHLDRAGVTWQPDQIPVNRRLQTSQPRLYACGSVPDLTSPADLSATARQEAEVALHNALFWPPRSLDLGWVPQVVPTDPELAWLGLSETAARRRYGSEVRVACASTKSLLAAQISGDSGFLKLIAHRNGRLLGAEAMGTEAGHWLGALAVQPNPKLSTLAQSGLTGSAAELIGQAVQDLQHQSPRWRRELLEAWFDFRRGR